MATIKVGTRLKMSISLQCKGGVDTVEWIAVVTSFDEKWGVHWTIEKVTVVDIKEPNTSVRELAGETGWFNHHYMDRMNIIVME